MPIRTTRLPLPAVGRSNIGARNASGSLGRGRRAPGCSPLRRVPGVRDVDPLPGHLVAAPVQQLHAMYPGRTSVITRRQLDHREVIPDSYPADPVAPVGSL